MTTVTDADKGIITSVTDPKGQVVSSQYDVLRRVTQTSTTMSNDQMVKIENEYNKTTGFLTSTKHNTSASNTDDVTYNSGMTILTVKQA